MTDENEPGDIQERRKHLAQILATGIRRLAEAGIDPSDMKKAPASAKPTGPSRSRTPFTVGAPRVISERPRVIECDINPAWLAERQRRRERAMNPVGPKPPGARSAPRVSRVLASAHRFERRLRRGEVSSFADIAAAERLTRARVTQMMDLLLLAPDVQEEVLFLPRHRSPDQEISERDLRQIVRTPIWSEQRRLWKELRGRQRVRLFFDASATHAARDSQWGTDRRTRQAKGGMELAMSVFPGPEFIAWVLAFGNAVEILEPATIREKVASELRSAAGRYKSRPEA